jgi:hypothetical protein
MKSHTCRRVAEAPSRRVAEHLLTYAVACVLAGVAAPTARAQNHGGGISSIGLGNAVNAELIRETWGPPDSIRLVAAVLFRAPPGVQLTRNGPETERAKGMTDSLVRDGRRRGVWSGGFVTPHSDQWIEFDPKSRTVYTQGRQWRATSHDSILVVLVDQRVTAGEKSVIVVENVFCPPDVDGSLKPGADLTSAMREQAGKWELALLGDYNVQRLLKGGLRP